MSEAATSAWPNGGTAGTADAADGQRKRDRRAYWEQWYADHKAEIAEKRSRLWREDPTFREQSNAARRRQRKAQRQAQRAQRKLVPKPPKTMVVAGRRQVVWTVRELAIRLGVSQGALRQWRLRGVLPPSPVRSGNGVHWYTEGMVVATIAVLAEGRERLGERLAAAWAAVLADEQKVVDTAVTSV